MSENKAIPNIDGKANPISDSVKKKIGKEILIERVKLHKSIVSKMRNLEICTAPEIVEKFKRWFLWDYCNVETSRALSLLQLKDAAKILATVTKSTATNSMLAKFTIFESKRNIHKLTNGQLRKIMAIAKYTFKLTAADLKTYASKRIDRDPYVSKYYALDITIQEADTLIKALEKWEAKILINKAG